MRDALSGPLVIIENTESARWEYGHLFGFNIAIMKPEHIQALLDGKCIAFNDGEYSTFVVLETKDDRPQSHGSSRDSNLC